MINAKWVATLSDGTTAVENEGEFELIPGQRRPFVRLVQKLGKEKQYLTSLRLNVDGRTIHLPKPKNNKFDEVYPRLAPKAYALEYQLEVDDVLGDNDQKHYIVLIAIFEGFELHYIQDLQDSNNSWITVTSGYSPMCVTPFVTV